jgi:hypothetical protein
LSLRSSTMLLMSCLRCWSSGSPLHLSPSPLLHPLNYIKKTLANYISPNGHVDHQTPKSKLNGQGSIFLKNSPFWCLMTTRLKQANNIYKN